LVWLCSYSAGWKNGRVAVVLFVIIVSGLLSFQGVGLSGFPVLYYQVFGREEGEFSYGNED
jgi:hypothetical protein